MTALEGFAHFLGLLRREPTSEELRARREQAERELADLHGRAPFSSPVPQPREFSDEFNDEPTLRETR